MDRHAVAAQLVANRKIRSRLVNGVPERRPLTKPVAKDVGHDREQPGFFVRARLEAVSVSGGSPIRFLRQGLGVLWLSGQAQGAAIERIDVPLKKRKVATHANAPLVHSIPTNSAAFRRSAGTRAIARVGRPAGIRGTTGPWTAPSTPSSAPPAPIGIGLRIGRGRWRRGVSTRP